MPLVFYRRFLYSQEAALYMRRIAPYYRHFITCMRMYAKGRIFGDALLSAYATSFLSLNYESNMLSLPGFSENQLMAFLRYFSAKNRYSAAMRILVVEDEHKIARAIQRGLEQERFAVDVVFDGKEGKSMALAEPYDLIILDRMLPNIEDGLEICRAIREKGLHTPVLILTARDQVQDKIFGLNDGADDYLTKPFAFEELVARVRALLRRPQEQIASRLTLADLVLDTTTYAVTRAGKLISLSAKEYSLLEYLLRRAGSIVRKETLIEHVWNYDADILPNTVEVYIGYLRAKIDKPFKGPPLIHTIRGFGYKLAAE